MLKDSEQSMTQSHTYIWDRSCGSKGGTGLERGEREVETSQRAGEHPGVRGEPINSPVKKKVSLKKYWQSPDTV